MDNVSSGMDLMVTTYVQLALTSINAVVSHYLPIGIGRADYELHIPPSVAPLIYELQTEEYYP